MTLENSLIDQRKEKRRAFYAAGLDPYGRNFFKEAALSEIVKEFTPGKKVSLAGRLTAMRSHGKSAFADLRDASGRLQIYVQKDVVGEEKFALFAKLDLGDILGVAGELFQTHTQEITVKVENFVLLSKSLRPLPEKWHGLKDVEMRYRQRYVDLIVNQEVREIFLLRSKIISKIREFFSSRAYLEVETPMMQPIAGGAAGKPFQTHHDALGTDLYLRIAPELYLKRLLVGGFDKVYEINRSFRNEGISTRHNPEFTMLEAYCAYSDCRGMMQLTKELFLFLADELLGKRQISYQGQTIDLNFWEEVSFSQLMQENFAIHPDDKEEVWIEKLKKKGVELEKGALSRTQLINLVGELIAPQAKSRPVFVVDLFAELCPLAKRKKEDLRLSDRFELYVGAMEIANAYSELNDPVEQRERFVEQAKARKKEEIDEDYLRALEYGMPPAGGLGIGIDRLVMLFSDSPSIREVIFFPQLKPEA
jgi:lysyl-tRNA synthetase class 2